MSKPFNPHDKYFKKAKDLGKRARSYFKIEEVDKRFQLLKTGQHILDLGAAPGSFSEYALERVGPSGFVLGVDLQEIANLGDKKRVVMIVGDINEDSTKAEAASVHPGLFDGIISDLAPKTSGILDFDQYESCELSYEVLRWAEKFMKRSGFVVMKVLQGGDFAKLIAFAKRRFRNVKTFKPDSSRDSSSEVYVVCW